MTKIVKSTILNEQYTSTVLENGLTVLVYERPERAGVFGAFGAKIGGINQHFSVDGKEYKVPEGVAHFLEHKMFEGKDGEDAFSLFARYGADTNAFTGFDRTVYVFNSNGEVDNCLRALLNFVSSPYFTPENVEKEQGIIGQEIRMYDDSDTWQLLMGAMGLMYHKHGLRADIAGTVESIAQITDQTLYDCYNAFYNPANMVLSVCGNITTEKVLELCAECLDMNVSPVSLKVISEPEDSTVVGTYAEKDMSIAAREFCIGFKLKPLEKDAMRRELLTNLVCEALFGHTSDFYRELYDKGLINQTFESESEFVQGAAFVLLMGESEQPQEVKKAVLEQLANARANGVDPDRFEESLRNRYGDEIIGYDGNESIALNLAFSHFKGCNAYGVLEILGSLTAADANALLQDSFLEQDTILYVINPKER